VVPGVAGVGNTLGCVVVGSAGGVGVLPCWAGAQLLSSMIPNIPLAMSLIIFFIFLAGFHVFLDGQAEQRFNVPLGLLTIRPARDKVSFPVHKGFRMKCQCSGSGRFLSAIGCFGWRTGMPKESIPWPVKNNKSGPIKWPPLLNNQLAPRRKLLLELLLFHPGLSFCQAGAVVDC